MHIHYAQETFQKIGHKIKGYVYDFSTDYDYIHVSDTLDIHKYLMKKNGIVQYKNIQIY